MADVTSPFGFPYPEDTDLVRDGAQDIENLATGVNDYLTGGYLYAGTRYYTSSGTFLKADPFGTGDIELRAIRVRLVGGGGGSPAVSATGAGELRAGSGGGGGCYAEKFYATVSSLSASVTVTVGAGGAAGTSAPTAPGSGGSSLFDTLSTSGGSPGAETLNVSTQDSRAGGAGGSTTAGSPDLVIIGSNGTSGQQLFYDANGMAIGGAGGASHLAGSVSGDARFGGTFAGLAGNVYGGGASAPASGMSANSAVEGKAGGAGIVVVDCFV
jgi:hypothetical protein